jgi:hypothetical protein
MADITERFTMLDKIIKYVFSNIKGRKESINLIMENYPMELFDPIWIKFLKDIRSEMIENIINTNIAEICLSCGHKNLTDIDWDIISKQYFGYAKKSNLIITEKITKEKYDLESLYYKLFCKEIDNIATRYKDGEITCDKRDLLYLSCEKAYHKDIKNRDLSLNNLQGIYNLTMQNSEPFINNFLCPI